MRCRCSREREGMLGEVRSSMSTIINIMAMYSTIAWSWLLEIIRT